ncbi:MAG: peptidylprolyl isomerase [Planctomycetes bacterium]|nr:peptidylprolyl isomerase [Planctomycetota bacterium]
MMKPGLAHLAAAVAFILCGCDNMKMNNKSGDSSGAPPVAAGNRDDSRPLLLATVNGKPVAMKDLIDLLLEDYGAQGAWELVANELVRQEAAAKGIAVAEDDVNAEHNRTLAQILPQTDNVIQRSRLLDEYLQKNKISAGQWNRSMRRNAILRKLAESQAVVANEALRDEFNRVYGRKLILRHIQVENAAKAQILLDKLKAGADFGQMAFENSSNPSAKEGGQLPPVDDNSQAMPPAFMQVARSLRKPGDISDIVMVGTSFHIIRLEKIQESTDAKFEDVKDKLAAAVKERQVQVLQQSLLMKLIGQAERDEKIQYHDPAIKAAIEKKQERTMQ